MTNIQPLKYSIEASEYGINILRVYYSNYEPIEFDLTDFFKDTSNLETLFDKINEYVATLPEHIQKEIFETFYKVYSIENNQKYSDLSYTMKLENKIAKVSDLLNYENFKMWIRRKSNEIILPEGIQETFVYDPDMNVTVEKTYVKGEYIDLIALILFIRALSPLYLNYYNYSKHVTNHYYYKLFNLFVKSSIYESPEIEKLKRYIESNKETLMSSDKNEYLIINAGLSDDDILDSLVAEIIFNKLIPIDFFNKKVNIISYIFQTIKFKGNFTAYDGTAIRAKTSVNDPTKEDISYFEDYRKTSDIPIGTIVEIQHSLSDNSFIINSINKPFDINIYNREMERMHLMLNYRITDLQIYLLGWFLNRITNPRALYYIEYRRLVELMIIAKTFLLTNNLTFMGVLLGSFKAPEERYVNVLIKTSLNKAYLDRLKEEFKFVMDSSKQSVIEKTISEAIKEITDHTWVPTNSKEEYPEYINSKNYLNIPSNISELLCEYVLFSLA